jgi:hypothetical protein
MVSSIVVASTLSVAAAMAAGSVECPTLPLHLLRHRLDD